MDEYKWLTVTNADGNKLTRFIHPKICVDSEDEDKLVQNQWVEPQIRYLCELKGLDITDEYEYDIHPYLLVDELLKQDDEITVPRNDRSEQLGFFDFKDDILTEEEQAPEGFIKDEGVAAGAGGGDLVYRLLADINHRFKIDDRKIKVEQRSSSRADRADTVELPAE